MDLTWPVHYRFLVKNEHPRVIIAGRRFRLTVGMINELDTFRGEDIINEGPIPLRVATIPIESGPDGKHYDLEAEIISRNVIVKPLLFRSGTGTMIVSVSATPLPIPEEGIPFLLQVGVSPNSRIFKHVIPSCTEPLLLVAADSELGMKSLASEEEDEDDDDDYDNEEDAEAAAQWGHHDHDHDFDGEEGPETTEADLDAAVASAKARAVKRAAKKAAAAATAAAAVSGGAKKAKGKGKAAPEDSADEGEDEDEDEEDFEGDVWEGEEGDEWYSLGDYNEDEDEDEDDEDFEDYEGDEETDDEEEEVDVEDLFEPNHRLYEPDMATAAAHKHSHDHDDDDHEHDHDDDDDDDDGDAILDSKPLYHAFLAGTLHGARPSPAITAALAPVTAAAAPSAAPVAAAAAATGASVGGMRVAGAGLRRAAHIPPAVAAKRAAAAAAAAAAISGGSSDAAAPAPEAETQGPATAADTEADDENDIQEKTTASMPTGDGFTIGYRASGSAPALLSAPSAVRLGDPVTSVFAADHCKTTTTLDQRQAQREALYAYIRAASGQALGGRVWDGAVYIMRVLTRVLQQAPAWLDGLRALELGAGTGVVGIWVWQMVMQRALAQRRHVLATTGVPQSRLPVIEAALAVLDGARASSPDDVVAAAEAAVATADAKVVAAKAAARAAAIAHARAEAEAAGEVDVDFEVEADTESDEGAEDEAAAAVAARARLETVTGMSAAEVAAVTALQVYGARRPTVYVSDQPELRGLVRANGRMNQSADMAMWTSSLPAASSPNPNSIDAISSWMAPWAGAPADARAVRPIHGLHAGVADWGATLSLPLLLLSGVRVPPGAPACAAFQFPSANSAVGHSSLERVRAAAAAAYRQYKSLRTPLPVPATLTGFAPGLDVVFAVECLYNDRYFDALRTTVTDLFAAHSLAHAQIHDAQGENGSTDVARPFPIVLLSYALRATDEERRIYELFFRPLESVGLYHTAVPMARLMAGSSSDSSASVSTATGALGGVAATGLAGTAHTGSRVAARAQERKAREDEIPNHIKINDTRRLANTRVAVLYQVPHASLPETSCPRALYEGVQGGKVPSPLPLLTQNGQFLFKLFQKL